MKTALQKKHACFERSVETNRMEDVPLEVFMEGPASGGNGECDVMMSRLSWRESGTRVEV
jgi:hypothetical protein